MSEPQPGPDIDAYRSANILVRQHGERALKHASDRIQALLLQGDERGAAAWSDIYRAILHLTAGPSDGSVRH